MNFREKALELEQSLCGAAMIDGSWLTESDLTADDFLNEKNKIIWQSVLAVHARNEPTDIVTVNSDMKSRGFEWAAFLSEIQRNTPSAANWAGYEKALKRYVMCAKAQDIYTKGLESLGKDDSSIDNTIGALMALNTTQKDYSKDTRQMVAETVDQLEKKKNGEIKAMSSGLVDLDAYLGGFHDSDLIVIAGRPAMGKTAAMLVFALGAKANVGIISSEQGASQVGERLIANLGSVAVQSMRQGKLSQIEWDAVGKSGAKLINEGRFFINDDPRPDIRTIERQARKWKHQNGIKAIFVDYIQRIAPINKKTPKHEQVGEIAKGLKSLARELDIPVIALAQVSRNVESRPNKRPQMADISDSSEIEKEADQIITLYRDEVYNENTPEKGIIELGVKKNRHGSTNYVRAMWRGEYMQIKDVTRGDY